MYKMNPDENKDEKPGKQWEEGWKEEPTPKLEETLRCRGYFDACLIGRGAFSKVYRVKNRQEGRHYACKVSAELPMLFNEAALLRKLSHPLFPKFRERWQEQGFGFLVMEYVPGTGLDALLKRRGRLTENTAAFVGIELAQGLIYLHEQEAPVFYQDLKPQNIRIGQDGRVKLLDFGCACRMGGQKDTGYTEAGGVMRIRVGTPGFAAPEQLAGLERQRSGAGGHKEEEAAAAADIYGFGRILECMLLGFSGEPVRKRTGKKAQKPFCRVRSRLPWRGAEKSPLLCLAEECTRPNPLERPADMRLCLYRMTGYAEGVVHGKYRVEKYVWKKSGTYFEN